MKERFDMALFDKIGGFVKDAGEKTSNYVETTKLNSKISAEERGVAAIVTRIGEYYLAKLDSGEVLDSEVMNMFEGIKAGRLNIATIKDEIAKLNAPEPEPEPAPVPAPAPVPTYEAAPAPAPVPSYEPAPAAQKLCPVCGMALAADAKFCPYCGAKLE